MSSHRPAAPDPAVVLVPGPWTHRQVGANGCRFHVAELGEGPLVLLLHGFPEFWWCWREQLTGLAAQGFRAVAVDLRGYGGSDKPPRGYDLFTLSADVAALVSALGEQTATIVGHDWGAALAWAAAALHPQVLHRLVAVSMPHPLAFRSATRTGGPQLVASRYMLAFQLPWRPERVLVADGAAEIGAILRRWGGPGFPDADAERRYREHAQIPAVVHSAMEYYRWAVRSQARPDGARFARAMARPVTAPTLQIHGSADPCTLLATARGNGRYVAGPYALVEMRGVGHFPHEESPDEVTGHIAAWAR
ncbi:MAG TPA: alpha/beta hydrolase [Mycobacteriales bacterium]